MVYVELPDLGRLVSQGESFGAVESVKATSDINFPVSDTVIEVNEKLTESPGKVLLFSFSGEAKYKSMTPMKEHSSYYMGFALQQAKLALEALEVPVGCVILEDGKVIASGRNRTNETRNATRHAEMEAIDELVGQWRKDRLSPSQVSEKLSRCVLYVTCEPCIMCASALSFLGIKEVYYGCANDKFGGCGSILSLQLRSEEAQGYKCIGGIMADEAVSLFKCFYEQGNPNAPKPHRPVLLKERTGGEHVMNLN